MANVVALIGNLMDRSRLAAVGGIDYVTTAKELVRRSPGADVALIDLDRADAAGLVGRLAELRSAEGAPRIVGYGSHVNRETLARARADGADAVVARSQLLGNPLRWLSPEQRSG